MARSIESFGFAALLPLIAALAGCRTPAPTPPTEPLAPPRTIAAETAAALVVGHNQRVELLRKVHASGVLEFRWVDDEGKEHFEPQVNAKLWIRAPRDTALRAEKLGEVLFWIGSDAERYWLFDFVSDAPGLTVGRHDDVRTGRGEGLLLVRPLALLDLLAVTPIVDLAAPVTTAPGTAAGPDEYWQITTVGAGGPMRVFFDPATRLPARVETLNLDGSVALTSTLHRYRSVTVKGVGIAARPRLATSIDITDPDGSISVKLAFDPANDATRDRLFDLETLREHLK